MAKIKTCHLTSVKLLLNLLIRASLSIQLTSATFDSSNGRFRRQAKPSPVPGLIPSAQYSFHTEVCAGRPKTISCQSNFIFVEDAFYGRADVATCSGAGGRSRSTTCESTTSFAMIYESCNGKRTCSLSASEDIFGDPCPGTSKYIIMQFRCAPLRESMIGLCFPNAWGSWINLDSPSNGGDMELLEVHQRRTRDACENPIGMEIGYAGNTGAQWPADSDAIRHNAHYGVSCMNSDQQGQCKDYRVRYCCLGGTTTSSTPAPGVTCSVRSFNSGLVATLPKLNWNPSETIRIRCPTGYNVDGASVITCRPNGRWSAEPGICQPATTTTTRTIPTRPTTLQTGCGRHITGRQSGQIRSPNYPNNYPPSQDCVWTITVNPGQHILITFTNVDVNFQPRCTSDYIELFNGTSRRTGTHRFCGKIAQRMHRTNVPSLTVRFVSDSRRQGKGFIASWRAVPVGGNNFCATPELSSGLAITNIKTSYVVGEFIHFQCSGIRRLTGRPRLQCQSGGNWNAPVPTCDLPPESDCTGVGDPHYRTFDNKRYDFQGVCSYILVQNAAGATDIPSFIVEVDNEHRGRNMAVSWLRKAMVKIGNSPLIELTKGPTVTIDGEVINLPYSNSRHGINIGFSGRFVQITTEFGLKVLYDGNAYIGAVLPNRFAGKVEGLCGNYNGDPDDDCKSRTSDVILTDANEFANQYQTETKEGCSPQMPPLDVSCTDAQRTRFTRLCSILTNEDGCFSSCHSRIDPIPYRDNCVFDACAYNDAAAALENNVGDYAKACQDLEINICSWRDITETPLPCRENSLYSVCTTRCPATCSSPGNTDCESACVEGCVCNEGYVLSGDTCVKQEDCGCTYQGKYYKAGEIFYPTASCNRRCSCRRGRAVCRLNTCRTGLTCGLDSNGKKGCIPEKFGICRGWGDPHFQPYDATDYYDFQGVCTYILSRTNGIRQTDPRWFSVEGSNEHRGRSTSVSYLRELKITLSNGDAITLGKDGVATVNGQQVQEYESALFSIRPSGRFTELTTVYGLTVLFDGTGMRIRIPGTYMGQVHGLCGNFNDDKDDDFVTRSGSLSTDINEFAQSYQVGICRNNDLPPPFVCPPSEVRRWSGPGFCGPLRDATGVLGSCQSVVNSQEYFDNCVFDVCATEGDPTTLMQAFESYAAECQTNGVEICNWRRVLGFSEMECPPNSYYDGCASPCTDTCLNPFASANCRTPGTVESCVCNVGFVKDGNGCVKQTGCGCLVDGAYISQGKRITRRRLNEECTCVTDQLECSCLNGYSGKPCTDVNECARSPCDENASCTNTQGSYTCACNEGYTGNGRECTVIVEDMCIVPPPIEYGTFTPRNTNPRPVGSTLRYRCNPGYRIASNDNSVLRCGDGGVWSSSPPSCIDVNECARNPCDENASCTNTQGSYTCACNEGYTGNGRECTVIVEDMCIVPPPIEYGTFTPRNTNPRPVGSTLRYRCNPGYRIASNDNAVLRCGDGGVWSSSPPSCIDIDECVGSNGCHRNARCTNTKGSYTCSCIGSFVGNGRRCSPRTCPPFERRRFQVITPTRRGRYPVSSTVVFSCRGAYRVVGSARLTCNNDGTWNAAQPTCRVIPPESDCTGVGDPHYRTFDNKRYDFQGVCSYILVQNAAGATGIPSFIVEVDNEHRGRNMGVSWLRKAMVKIENSLVIELTKGPTVTIDGEVINLPYSNSQHGINIGYSGRFVQITTEFGLKVLYDGNAYIGAVLPNRFAGKVEGLCGNYNGDPDDDCKSRTSDAILTDVNEFANQYRTETKPSCSLETPPPEIVCSNVQRTRITRICSILTREDGCFSSCHSRIDAAPYLENCIFDACAYNDATAALDHNVGAYTKSCQDLEINVCPTWRNDTETTFTCGENSFYSACTTRCPATCSSTRNAECESACVEGCECNEGYVLSDDTCVKQEDCGCTYQGKYYKADEIFYPTASCNRRCSCRRGRAVCRPNTCRTGLTCGLDSNGKRGCIPEKYGICRGWGDPHFQPYDATEFYDFQGVCTYILSRSNGISQTDPRWFSVEGSNEHRGRSTKVSYLRELTIRLSNGDVITLGKDGVATVNGQTVQEYQSTLFSIRPSGRFTELTTTHGLTVLFDGTGMRIRIPCTYMSQVQGLCGNFNGEIEDDFVTISGTPTTDINEFAASYQVGDCAIDVIPTDFICTPANRRRWSGNQFCGMLTRNNGVFAACHSAVDVQEYFNDCVFDVCANEGDRTTLRQALETYAADCQFNDMQICSWREDAGIEMGCPPNSHYDGCASPCTDTCLNPFASANCRTSGKVEGCVCNVGYIRDGDNCIRRSECGCLLDGVYVSKGLRINKKDQNEECACLGQNMVECACVTGYSGKPCRVIVEDMCILPPPIENGVYTPRNTNPRPVGSTLRYRCNPGYRIASNGNAVLRCGDGGVWSSSPPSCIIENECTPGAPGCPSAICEEQDLPDNVIVHPRNVPQRRYKDVITYSCRPGYIREGSSSATCLLNGEWTNGPPSCRRANFDRRYCTASGDPHYDSFDGLHYDFQGECRYDFIETTPAARTAGLVEFTVETENEFRPGITQGTWLRRALFRFPAVSVELRKDLVVLIDGISTDLPYSHPSGIDVLQSGRFVTIMTEFGLEARYDGDHFLTVGLPASYSGFVEGLCGNYNGDPTDEFLLRGGRIMAEDNVAFGNSFQINSISECERATASDDACAEASARAMHENRCNVIREPGGCFAACHSTIDPIRKFQDCVFDLCASGGNARALEQNVATYATSCQSNDISFCDWRRDTGMPLQCQENSHYSRCTSACPNTCVDRDSARLCPFLCVEGCECDDGFVLSGTQCVKEDACGCTIDGRYHMSGKSFFIGGCNQLCSCSNGRLTCTDEGGCPAGQRCSPDDSGLLGCRLPQASCNEEPIRKTIKLPSSCLNPDGSTKYVNVGACPSVTCPKSRSQQNSDADDQCCGVATRRMEEITCRGGSVLRVSKVLTCECRQCNDRTITVSGMVYGFDAFGVETPLRGGSIFRNDEIASQTDDEGKFSINVDPDISRLVITFVDPNDQFMTTTKVLPFKRLGGAIFHKIRLPTKAPLSVVDSRQRKVFSPHSTTQSNVIKIEIEANSYFSKDGVTYPGMVSHSLTYIDPRQMTSYLEAPSDLLTEDGTMMRSYGMFEMDFRDSDNMELDVRNIRIFLSADQVSDDGDRENIRLWSLNQLTGLWMDEGKMTIRHAPDGMVFTANIPLVSSRRTLNIDVPARRTCYIKVRTYGSNAYNPSDQLSYAKVNSVFRESAIDQWRNFGSSLTLPDTGACLRVFCDVKDDAYTGTFDASINDMEYLDAAPSRRQNANIIGVSDEILQQINYQRTTVGGTQLGFSINIPRESNTTHNKGPLYRENFDCLIAPTSDFHFRFSRKSNSLVEFNTIPIDENNMYFTWQPQLLNWWPSLTEFRACYIKVKLMGTNPSRIVVSVNSRVGTGRRADQFYGIREDISLGRNRLAAACIEFRCSGTAPPSGRTLVEVNPARNSCRRTAVNRRLGNYLRANKPVANQSNARSYRMFAPRDALGHTYGIYTVSGNDPVIAKQLALGRCMAGQSTEVSDRMVLGNNVAVTFTC